MCRSENQSSGTIAKKREDRVALPLLSGLYSTFTLTPKNICASLQTYFWGEGVVHCIDEERGLLDISNKGEHKLKSSLSFAIVPLD